MGSSMTANDLVTDKHVLEFSLIPSICIENHLHSHIYSFKCWVTFGKQDSLSDASAFALPGLYLRNYPFSNKIAVKIPNVGTVLLFEYKKEKICGN